MSKVGEVVLTVMLFVVAFDELLLVFDTLLDPFKLNVSLKKPPTLPNKPPTLSAALLAKSLIPLVTLDAMLLIPFSDTTKHIFNLTAKVTYLRW